MINRVGLQGSVRVLGGHAIDDETTLCILKSINRRVDDLLVADCATCI
jgi:hypothetical protein